MCSGDLVWILQPGVPVANGPAAVPPPPPVPAPAPEPAPMDVDADPSTPPSPPSVPVPVGLRLPGHLLRVLCANPDPRLTAAAPGLALLIAHAAMLETGFVPIGAGSDPYAMPSGWQVTPSVARVAYSLSPGGGPAAELTCSEMGTSMVLAAAAADGRHARHVMVDWDRPGGAPWVTEGAGAAAPSADSKLALAVCPHVTVTAGQRILLHGGSLALEPALRDLWNERLKDGLAVPALGAARAAAGLPPPAGLLTLPTEVKDAVLRRLGGLDLAALGATCSELRHLAAADALWGPLFGEEFPSPPADVADAATRRGYKWAYGHLHAERRRTAEQARRRRRRYLIPGVPHFGPHPPFYPAPAPPGFPGMIGGDQDRFPQLPPSLGGGGLGGGGAPGGVFFGGASGSARRQGGHHSWF